MRFYTNQYKYYCGVDLHANKIDRANDLNYGFSRGYKVSCILPSAAGEEYTRRTNTAKADQALSNHGKGDASPRVNEVPLFILRRLYLCALDSKGAVLSDKNIDTEPSALPLAVAPYQEDLMVGVECMFCCYWLADLCRDDGIRFALDFRVWLFLIEHFLIEQRSKEDRHRGRSWGIAFKKCLENCAGRSTFVSNDPGCAADTVDSEVI